MAESAVSYLIGQLSTWISQEQRLLGSLTESGEFIVEEMGHLRAFLRVADEKQEVNPQLKEWVNQVRNLAYDAEDVMDEFMLRFAAHPTEGCLLRVKQVCACVKNLKYRRRLASEMRSIQLRVKRISEGQQRYKDIYGAAEERDNQSWYDSRGDALLLEETEVVGVEKPKKQLLDWLSSTAPSQMKVISVVGRGGLGKTTVVKKVYEDAAVKALFTTRLWVTLSNSYKLEELLKTMIRKLVSQVKQPPPEGLDAMDADEMKEFIYRFLEHKSYVVVVDDIWRVEDWEAIRYAFPRSRACSFIIITSRFHSIGNAAAVDSNGHVYNLEPLSEEDSKELFCRKAFAGGSCPTYLEEMADFLLNKCEGLPLAIVVIGSLLATKRNDVEEWKKLCRSLGDELEGNHLSKITRLLSLSYYDLPYYLKSCFLYMSVFKEDKMVFVSRLIRMWIAEGFVHPKMGKTMEEVAEEYVKELIDRSLFQVMEPPFYDRPLRVRVHDLLHAMLVSKSKEQSFVTVANSGETQWPDKIRRLVVHGSSDMDAWPDPRGCRHLRSLLLFDIITPPSKLSLPNLLRTTRLLKVLELRGSAIETIPDEVFRLCHLKLLSLKGTKVKTISRLIGKLEKLEILNFKNTRVTELPVEILRLRRLQQLLVIHYRMERGYRPFNNVHSLKAPYRIGCLSSLQTLFDIDATAADDTTIVREIGKLKQLKELGINKLREEDGKDLCISLTKLTRLETLYIVARDEDEILDLQEVLSPAPPIRSLELRGRLLKVPQWITTLQGLTRLILLWSRIDIDDDPLESFEHLPNLKYLELCHAYQGNSLCFKASGFQRLKKLTIENLEGLERLRVEEGSMPILQVLCIRGCKAMNEVASGIEHLQDLQYVEFSNMSEGFVRALERQKVEEKEEWKLRHIPKVEIYSLTHADQWEGRRL